MQSHSRHAESMKCHRPSMVSKYIRGLFSFTVMNRSLRAITQVLEYRPEVGWPWCACELRTYVNAVYGMNLGLFVPTPEK